MTLNLGGVECRVVGEDAERLPSGRWLRGVTSLGQERKLRRGDGAHIGSCMCP